MTSALIIEDDDNNLLLISDLLQLSGYQVLKATTGREGVASALRERPDFIILDIGLPDIDGTEVLNQIRASGIDGDIPVIAMTSYAMSGDAQRLLGAGCSGYIEKPINPQTVIEEIEAMIRDQSAD